MASFLERLKKDLTQSRKLKVGLAYDEYLSGFRGETKAIVSVYLDYMKTWLLTTDEKLNRILEKYQHESVAAQDPFSRERRLLLQIDSWIAQDDLLRTRFKELVKAYSAELKLTDMEKELEEILILFEDDFKEHVEQANKFAKDWQDKFAKVSFTLTNRKAVNTFAWFSTLTVEKLKKDYQREMGSIKKP